MKLKRLTPSFSVSNVQETVKFYKEILDFKVDRCIRDEMDGIDIELEKDVEYIYAMVIKDELSFIFIQEDYFRYETLNGQSFLTGNNTIYYIDVNNIEEFYHQLIKKNIKIIQELHTTRYAVREFSIKDNDGHLLYFSEEL